MGVMRQGASGQRMLELHIIEARTLALDLFSRASTVYPAEWKPIVGERLLVGAVEFASHAYRVVELGDLKSPFVGAAALRFSAQLQLTLEDDFKKALNAIRHSQNLTLGFVGWDGSKVFLAAQDQLIPAYLKIETDKFTSNVSLFGVAFTFLTAVLGELKQSRPDLSF